MKKTLRDYQNGGVQYAYILDAIDGTNYSVELQTDEERAKLLFSVYMEEYGWSDRRMPRAASVEQWLRGLPSAIYIDFCDAIIAEIGRRWGYCQTPKKEAEFINNWWSVMASRIVKIWNYYGIF